MNNIIKRVWNQNRMVNIEDLCGMAFQAESGGHTFAISGVDDTGAVVPLTGTVAGVFRRPDNADIALTGSASDGVASVTLTDDCYAVPGRFGLTVFVTSGGQKTAVYAAIGTVASTNGGAVAGDTPQDVVDLINAIEAAVATIPADYTDLMAAIAPTYSPSGLYPVGFYVWHDGNLHKCIVPITTAETWTAAHWTAAVLGDDVVDIKSALPAISNKSGLYTTINNNTDYNTITTPGTYLCLSNAAAQSMTNCPTSYQHKLFVVLTTNEARLYQIIFSNDTGVAVYKRFMYGTTWGAWKKEASLDDIPSAQVAANTSDIAKIKASLPSISTTSGTYSVIADNSNYDNITTPGTYICVSATSAQTMTNCPTNWANKMFVVAVSNIDRLCQIVIANDLSMAVYKRYYYNGWGKWKKEAYEYQGYKVLVIGDSYSQQGRWTSALSDYIKIDTLVNLGVTSASVKDKYSNRSTYPYTSRPTKDDNTGNHNTFMCQIEKLKRLMAGTDLDTGEEQIYTSADDYPNIIIIEGGQNDQPDSSSVVDSYANQFMEQVSNVYVAYNSEQVPTLGTAYIKLSSEECDRTCFAGAYRSLVEELQSLFPKAQIFATSRTLLGYWNAERFPAVTDIRQQQELVCNMIGIDFINWQAGAQINLMNNYPKGSGTQNDPYCFAQVAGDLANHDTYDLLHPFTLGARKYAKVVANYINTHFLDMENMYN